MDAPGYLYASTSVQPGRMSHGITVDTEADSAAAGVLLADQPALAAGTAPTLKIILRVTDLVPNALSCGEVLLLWSALSCGV